MPGTTPVYGFPYPEPTDLVADYPALGQDLAEDIEAVLPTIGGLAPATPTSVANSGGSASLSGNTVTFSGVSSVSLNGCFTASHDNFCIVMRALGSIANDIQVRLRAAGSDSTGNVYNWQRTATTNSSGTGVTLWNWGATLSDFGWFCMDVSYPFLADRTGFVGVSTRGTFGGQFGGSHSATSSYDGLTIFPDTGTITGKIAVYGYKK